MSYIPPGETETDVGGFTLPPTFKDIPRRQFFLVVQRKAFYPRDTMIWQCLNGDDSHGGHMTK